MTVQHNRYLALLRTRDFLRELSGANDEVGRRAASLLKHYPNSAELHALAEACPALLAMRLAGGPNGS